MFKPTHRKYLVQSIRRPGIYVPLLGRLCTVKSALDFARMVDFLAEDESAWATKNIIDTLLGTDRNWSATFLTKSLILIREK